MSIARSVILRVFPVCLCFCRRFPCYCLCLPLILLVFAYVFAVFAFVFAYACLRFCRHFPCFCLCLLLFPTGLLVFAFVFACVCLCFSLCLPFFVLVLPLFLLAVASVFACVSFPVVFASACEFVHGMGLTLHLTSWLRYDHYWQHSTCFNGQLDVNRRTRNFAHS